jgi:ribosome-associated toxin RatA of RatAB toxin-antitoxin module
VIAVDLESGPIARSAEEVFDRLADFVAYPRFASSVRSVAIHEEGPGWCISEWAADFRNGVMCWRERDVFLREQGLIEFRQLDGDLDRFDGAWTIWTEGEEVRVRLTVEFDLGLPTLAEFLEPVAAGALEENMRRLVHGLFGEAVEVSTRIGEVVVLDG